MSARAKRLQRPGLINQLRAYYLVDLIFAQLANGEIDSIRGEPYFKDPRSGEWFEVHAALEGWCELWAKLLRRYSIDRINLAPVLQVNRLLHAGAPVTEELVAQAREVVDQTRKAYRSMDTDVVDGLVRDTRIRIHLEDKGVIAQGASA